MVHTNEWALCISPKSSKLQSYVNSNMNGDFFKASGLRDITAWGLNKSNKSQIILKFPHTSK